MKEILILLASQLCFGFCSITGGCRKPPSGDIWISNPIPKKSHYEAHDVITYRCKHEGFKITGIPDNSVTSATIFCGEDGIWSGPRPCCEEIKAEPQVIWLTGPPSETHDDAPSDVYCPDGYYVTECKCANDHICDGIYLSNTDVKKCRATKRWNKPGHVEAVAKCVKAKDEDVRTSIDKFSPGKYPCCPRGYKMLFCGKGDPWAQSREVTLSRTVHHGVDSCEWSSSQHVSRYVFISIICIKEI